MHAHEEQHQVGKELMPFAQQALLFMATFAKPVVVSVSPSNHVRVSKAKCISLVERYAGAGRCKQTEGDTQKKTLLMAG